MAEHIKKKRKIIAITSDGEHGGVTHASSQEDVSPTLYTATYSGRSAAAPRRYKVSYGCHHRHEHYHEATIITVARLTVINHATGMIRLNCCSHVSALEALPCRSLHGRKSDAGRGTDGGGRREIKGEERVRDLSPPRGRRGPAAAREAMSVTSGNYARVPVAIGLLILLGARWVRSLCSRRGLVGPVAYSSARRGVRP